MGSMIANRTTVDYSKEEEAQADSKKSGQLREMFERIAGDDGEVDAEELQDVLTASFSKG